MNTINKFKITAITLILIGFSSCNKEDDMPVLDIIKSEQVINFAAPQTGGQGQPIGGEFSKFDFKTGMKTTSDTEWDIAFRGTTIAINGGVKTGTADEPDRNGNCGSTIVNGTFESVTNVDGLTFAQDSDVGYAIPTGSDNGWYNYSFQSNIISAIPGKVLVFRTHDDKYAKVEILSYYLDQDSSNPAGGRNYTFNYVYNPNSEETSFE